MLGYSAECKLTPAVEMYLVVEGDKQENLICEVTSASTEFHGKMKLVTGEWSAGVGRRLQEVTGGGYDRHL